MTDTGFGDPIIAQKARDALTRLMIRTLDQERPPYQYGTVTSIDPSTSSCMVLLPGDTVSVKVRFGAVRPAFTGQVVRVSGIRNDRFISDVIGGAIIADNPASELSAPTGVIMAPYYESVTIRWNAMPEASRYEVQFADDLAFTINVRSFQTISNEVTQLNLTAGSVVYGRVRALTSYGDTGPWSSVVSATVGGLIGSGLTDGIPPGSSPAPVITPGIGFLLAEWLPTSNVDQVTYEVHISTVSGFSPTSLTKIGEITGTFYFIRRLPSGSALSYATTYFVRIIAKDGDGAAAAGAQGSGSPVRVETTDVGTIPISDLSDGSAPSSSPTPTITNGIGYLFATWTHITNADPVTYEIHVSLTSGFTPNTNTLVGQTESNFAFIRNQGPGATPPNGLLVYGDTYYVKLIAKDSDGQAAAGGQGSGTPTQAISTDIGPNSITTGHIQVGSITAASGIIADAAIATAKIQDAAITTAKIGSAQITTALIGDAQIVTAKIADAAIATAKIGDAQVTSAKIVNLTADKIVSGTISASTAIQIASGGVVQSTNYVSGTTGFQIRGNGSAEFNNVTVRGTIDGSTIIGSIFKTAGSGNRIEINPFYSMYRISFVPATSGTEGYIEGFINTGIGFSTGWLRIAAAVPSGASSAGALVEMVSNWTGVSQFLFNGKIEAGDDIVASGDLFGSLVHASGDLQGYQLADDAGNAGQVRCLSGNRLSFTWDGGAGYIYFYVDNTYVKGL